jgi:hypothetical protein
MTGMDLLNRQGLNNGTAFTDAERRGLGSHGLLPPQVEALDEQSVRAYEAYQRKTDDLERPPDPLVGDAHASEPGPRTTLGHPRWPPRWAGGGCCF